MNRGILDVRLAAVLFIFLMGSVSLIGANQRAEANEAINASCSSCGSSSSAAQVLNTTILEGEEKNKAVATAISSEDYKNVKKLFPESVYVPSVEQAKAGIINLELNGTKYEALAVFVPFEARSGFSAGIIFSKLKDRTMAIGAVVDIQNIAPVFAAMSVDGKAAVIPLQGSCSCRSCGSGVSPLVDQCSYDGECVQMYGEGWCCIDYQCQPCPPPPPSCKVRDEFCYSACMDACWWAFFWCLLTFDFPWCIFELSFCGYMCNNNCCIEW